MPDEAITRIQTPTGRWVYRAHSFGAAERTASRMEWLTSELARLDEIRNEEPCIAEPGNLADDPDFLELLEVAEDLRSLVVDLVELARGATEAALSDDAPVLPYEVWVEIAQLYNFIRSEVGEDT